MSDGAVLIVGGSSGIGLALACQFTQNGYDVVLVARDQARLQVAAQQVSLAGHAKVHTIALDATTEDAPGRLVDELANCGTDIRYIVFSSGLWQAGPVSELSSDQLRRLLECNVVVLHALLRALLPALAPGAGVLLVGSLAGFAQLPGMSGYSTSKACLHALAFALREEFAARQLNVSLLAPGPVNTGFLPRPTGSMQQLLLDLVTSSPDTVARAAYCGLRAKSAVIVPGLIWHLAWLGMHVVPASLVTKCAFRISNWARQRTSAANQVRSD